MASWPQFLFFSSHSHHLGCDDIIRQHKTACLRVTALLACKDLLWIGTSSGVVLTLTLPHLTPGTAKLDAVPHVSG